MNIQAKEDPALQEHRGEKKVDVHVCISFTGGRTYMNYNANIFILM